MSEIDHYALTEGRTVKDHFGTQAAPTEKKRFFSCLGAALGVLDFSCKTLTTLALAARVATSFKKTSIRSHQVTQSSQAHCPTVTVAMYTFAKAFELIAVGFEQLLSRPFEDAGWNVFFQHWKSEHGYEDSCDYWTLLLSRAMLKGCFSILCTYDQEHFSAIWLSCFSLLCSSLLGFCLVCWCFFRLLLQRRSRFRNLVVSSLVLKRIGLPYL